MSRCSGATGAASPTPRKRLDGVPSGRGRARRHLLPHRPRGDGAGAWLRAASANSLDAVSDRDFALETLAAAAIAAMHLSRLAEEIVNWTSPQWGFVRLSDKFTTGSSIMPQKRNPDAAELVRAKTGRIAGAFQALLMVMKGLPLAYAKDMQEDKEPVFDALDALKLGLAAMTGMVEDIEPDLRAMKRAAASRPCHRHRPRRLARAQARAPLPGGPPHRRQDRGPGRITGLATSKNCLFPT